MPAYKVKVKWQKASYDTEVDTSEPPIVFKAQLFALTNVKPERQKVMLKGKTLKDDEWDGFPITNNATLMMMGTVDSESVEALAAAAPKEKLVFVEDMNENERNKALNIPSGLKNLGNTCYMNATVQCLRNIPELKESLSQYTGTIANQPVGTQAVTFGFRELIKSLEKASGAPVTPFIFLQLMHGTFPQFAAKDEQGMFSQQDANEFWSELVSSLKHHLPGVLPSFGSGQKMETDSAAGASASSSCKFVEQYFRTDLETTFKCLDEAAKDEVPSTGAECLYQMSCFIDKDVKYLYTGLKNSLEEKLTKRSPTLDHDALYQKTAKLVRLPAYLSVQFVRFYYKEKDQVNAKVLKDVKFPLTLDMFDFCSSAFQQKLVPMRDRLKAEEDKRHDKLKQERLMEVDEDKKVEPKVTKVPYWFPDDVGSNNSGFYELQAVLTHKGRASNSGHYVAWVRDKGDQWFMFDDDEVSTVTSEEILRLSGGGDWHSAYVLLYGPKILEVQEDEDQK